MNNVIRYISLFLLVSLFSAIKAQEAAYYEPEQENREWHVGAFAGLTHFYGDVSDKNFFEKFSNDNETTPNFGIVFGKKMYPWLTLRAQYFSAGLNSYNRSDELLISHMETKYDAFGIHGKVHLNPVLWDDYKGRNNAQLYGFGGLSFVTWNAKLDLLNDDTFAREETGSDLALDIGGGVDYRIFPNWKAFMEASLRFVPSDQLDLVQRNFQSDVPLSVSFGFTYNFGIKDEDRKEKKRQRDLEEEKKEEEEKLATRTKKENYRRLPGEGPDVLDFTMSGCSVEENQQQSASARGSGNSSKPRKLDKQKQSGSSGTTPEIGQGVIFSVQILATSKPANISQLKNKYNLNQNIREYHSGGIYRYVVGQFRHYEEAVAHSLKMQSKGAEGAFVVVFRNGKKVKMTPSLKKR
ncbi:MAG: SPOR domain-containing protein [Bacteroidales bacterium]|nr:SPOR domain-containing protein [Bacteroidales bacterium]MCF8334188.1 SPOR domain-containing protein [Bacteroidales bacterium]